jgi:hypothetical protein
VSSSEEDIKIEETMKQMDNWKDEISMILLSRGTLDQMDDAIEVDQAKKRC